MSTGDEGSTLPKSMRHKQILDAAADHPDASVEDLASMVPSATADLVERVLDEHGDPAADDAVDSSPEEHTAEEDTANDQPSAESTADSEAGEPTLAALSDKQRAVLEHVAMDPTATQQAIGERLDVTGATVSNRVNDIDGFSWSNRRSFVTKLFATNETPPATASVQPQSENGSSEDEPVATERNESEPATDDIDVVGSQLDALLDELETAKVDNDKEGSTTSNDRLTALEDPELVHKTVQCWLEDDRFSKADELALLRALFA